MSLHVWLLGGCAIAVLWLAKVCRALCRIFRWKRLIDRIPGPRGLPLLGVACHFLTKKENITRVAFDLCAPYAGKYPLIRLWLGPFPNVVILKSEAAKTLLSSNKHIEKAFYYKYMHSWIGDGLVTSTGAKWQQRRKLITPSFHFRILENFLLVMNEQADILVDILEQKCRRNNYQQFDICPFISRCALDIICATAMGQGADAQTNSDSEYVNAVTSLTEVINWRVLRPWLAPDCLFRLSSLGREERKSLKIIHGFTNKIIQMKRSKLSQSKMSGQPSAPQEDVPGLKHRVALLDMLLDNGANGHPLTDEDIREEVETFMFAGHDTTSVALGWAVYFIGQYPEVQQKIVDELDAVFGDGDREATSEDLHNLKYLECVMKESMRLIAVAPMFARSLNEDFDICGYTVPKGVTIIVVPHWIHSDGEHFKDPEKFNPDNFLPENCKDRDSFAFIPFSAGLRNCIGQKYGMMEEKVVLSRMLRKFRIESVTEPDLITNITLEMVSRPVRGVQVKLFPRTT